MRRSNVLRLFICHIHPEATEADLRDACEKFGKVTEVWLAKNQAETGHKTYGFVTFENESDGRQACMDLEGTELPGFGNGRTKAWALHLEEARPRPQIARHREW